MMTFAYVCRDIRGSLIRGRVEAEDDSHARARLQRQGLFITSLRRQWWAGGARGGARTQGEVAALTHHLAMLVGSGLPLSQALQVLSEHTDDERMSAVVQDLVWAIEEGRSLSDALERRPDLFSAAYVGMVRNGEVSGRLDQALERLASYIDRDLEVQRRVREALVYPAIVLTLAAAVLAVFLIFIIPAFDRIYRAAGAHLPPLTRALLVGSRVFRAALPYVPLAVLLGVLPPTRRLIWPVLGARLHALVLRLPRVGTLAKLAVLSRFAHAMGMMLQSGVPILSALEVAGKAVGTKESGEVIEALKRQIMQGQRLAEAMRETHWFTPMIIRMTSLGEESGKLDAMLDRGASILDREFDLQMKRLLTFLEPALTVLVGGIVGVILLALYLPIFGLARAVVH
jgi:type II secretory pathway component PulF